MKNSIRVSLPEKVTYIINTITKAGYEAFAVGGCIRDSLLGRVPDDWDITTSAPPLRIKELFDRTIDTGIQHGTVTVMLKKEGFEVTTYRIDGEYEDARHPKEVTFTSNLTEDLKRRDFTINAMAYNDEAGLIDVFGGMRDMERKVIRCVGEPEERFTEDALRMMRAVRFSAQLGYSIDRRTEAAIKKLAPSLVHISAERVQTELVKLVVSPHPENLRLAYEAGITKVILPEFDVCMETEQNNPHHDCSVGEHILRSMQEIRPDKVLRLAMLMHDIGKPRTMTWDEEGVCHFHGHPAVSEEMARKILKRLKFDNYTADRVTKLVKFHDAQILPDEKQVRRSIRKMGEEIFPLLFEVKEADQKAQSGYLRKEKEAQLQKARMVYETVIADRQCVSLKTLAVTGKDLIEEAGMQPGPKLGETLGRLLDAVIEDPAKNKRELLLALAKEIK